MKFFSKILQFFSTSRNFFLQSYKFFLQFTFLFYNLAIIFYKPRLFLQITTIFYNLATFCYNISTFFYKYFFNFFQLTIQRYRNSLIKPRIIENWNLRLRTLNETRTQAEEVVGQNDCPEFRTLDTRPNIVHLLAINWEPKPEVKTSFSSNLELYWSPMYCPESIIAVNSCLSVSLSKYL